MLIDCNFTLFKIYTNTMKQLSILAFLSFLSLATFSCSNRDDDTETVVEASIINGGPYIFCIGDGESNFAVGLTIVSNGNGDDFTWIVTDEDNNILEIPKTIADTEAINFENSGTGNCKLWLFHFNNRPTNLQVDSNLFDDLSTEERTGLSNFIDVTRTGVDINTNTCPTL